MNKTILAYKDLKRLLGIFTTYIKGKKGLLFLGVFLGIISRLCALSIPLFSKFIIDTVIFKGFDSYLNITILSGIVILILLAGSSILSNYLLFKVNGLGGIKFKYSFFRKLQYAPFTFFTTIQKGAIAHRILTDTERIIGFWTQTVATLPLIVILGAGGAIMLHYNPVLSYFIFSIILLQILIIVVFKGPIMRSSFSIKENMEKLTSYTVEFFTKIELVRTHSTEKSEQKKFLGSVRKLFRAAFRNFMLNKGYNNIIAFLSYLWIFVVLWYGGTQILAGNMTIGTLSAFLLLVNILNTPIFMLTELVLSFQQIRTSLYRYEEFARVGRYLPPPSGGRPLKPYKPQEGRIELKGVSFGYNDHYVLRNINEVIEPNSITALVGRTGAGKSTFCRLLIRLFDPQSGSIYLDNRDIREIKIPSLRKSIHLSLQNNHVMNGTLWENLTYGTGHVDKKDVLLAMKKAGIDFHYKMPAGFDTLIGVHGLNLSGGECQRIAIARALLLNPKVFIFDETTAYIDNRTEEKIKDVLCELKRSGTVILITHRSSTLDVVDNVLLFDNGTITESAPSHVLKRDRGSEFFKSFYSKGGTPE
ncbi:MAG: ABC transporter ATP-binding protein [Spirochaetales bacterium]|nr:ABC transporter ATP-binding protein [Spirochaetales bacterium]